MGTKCAPPYACLVLAYKEETILFPIELPKFFSTEEIQIMKKVFRQHMDDEFLLWPAMLNFDNFMVCLNNLHPSINYTYEKAKVTKDEKRKFISTILYLIVKMKFLQMHFIKIQTLMIISHIKALIQNLAYKAYLITYNPSLPTGIFKYNDKRCKICRLYLIECSEFELANREIWKIKTNITCRSRNIIYYLKCKFSMYEIYIGKTVGHYNHGFKIRMNNYITESRSGTSTCKSPIHIFNSIKINNRQLEEPFFYIYVMLS